MVYRLMKRLIETAIHDKIIDDKREGFIEKLNAFYMNNQITTDQYNELMALLVPVESAGE